MCSSSHEVIASCLICLLFVNRELSHLMIAKQRDTLCTHSVVSILFPTVC